MNGAKLGISNVVKQYADHRALDNVSLDVRGRQLHSHSRPLRERDIDHNAVGYPRWLHGAICWPSHGGGGRMLLTFPLPVARLQPSSRTMRYFLT